MHAASPTAEPPAEPPAEPGSRQCACACGALTARTSGEPLRVYLCFCEDCQRLSGSAFAYRAAFRAEQVRVEGRHTVWKRPGTSGKTLAFAFCPDCGATLLTWLEGRQEVVALSVGGFGDKAFRAPDQAFWVARKHAWLALPGTIPACELQ